MKKKSDEGDYLLADWEPPVENTRQIDSYISPEPSPLFKKIESLIIKLKDGNEEIIPSLMANLKKIHSSEDEDIEDSMNGFVFFSQQIFEEDGFNLLEEENLFQNSVFVSGILKLLDYEMHYLCYLLLAGEYKSEILHKMLLAAKKSEYGMDCEECGQGAWWSTGHVLNYMITQNQLDSVDLKTIFEIALSDKDDLLLLGVARHLNTPVSVLKELEKIDRNVKVWQEHPWANGVAFDQNIAKVASKNLASNK